MKAITFTVEGMHCKGCADTIQGLLAQEAGVRKVETSFIEKEARILHDPSQISEARLKAAIEKRGFRATVKQA